MKILNPKAKDALEYADYLQVSNEVKTWIRTTLNNYVFKNNPTTDEVEHVIDYLSQNEVKKISQMSYPQAVQKAQKWVDKLKKQGEKVTENPEDVKTILDFKDGFRVVKLIGQNAFKREGLLMSNCVASYYGRDTEVYSLRDQFNNPHCTMEKDQQVKGKGNGDIHPKYVSYVVKFLEWAGMTVGDSEMAHLGYVNIEKLLQYIGNKKELSNLLFNKKYLYKGKKELLKDKDKNQLCNLDVLGAFPLIEKDDESIKVAFDIPLLVSESIEWIRKQSKKIIVDSKIKAGGDNSKLAGGDYSKLAGGGNSQLAGGDYSKLAGGGYSKLAGGGNSKLAGGDYSKLAGGGNSQLAGGDNSQLAGGYYSKLAGGNNSQLAGGDNSKLEVGAYGIAVGDNGSRAKGKLGAVIVLCEREKKYPYNFVSVKSGIIDGKKLKEDVWYQLKNKKFVEVRK